MRRLRLGSLGRPQYRQEQHTAAETRPGEVVHSLTATCDATGRRALQAARSGQATTDRVQKNLFDYNEIALFIKVVETGSFTEASRQLGIPKGTISRKVAQLEERLGTRLMQRNTRTLNITDAGRDLSTRCAGLLAQLEEATSGVRLGQSELAGNIRVVAPSSFVRHVLAQWIPTFMERYPGITFEVITSDSSVDLLEQGADIAFFIGHLPDSSFIARSIGDPAPVMVASPAYLDKHGVPKQPTDLQGHSTLSYGTTAGRAFWEFVGPEVHQRLEIEPRAASYDLDLLVAAALDNLGIAHVPRFLVSQHLNNGRLLRVLREHHTSIGELSMIYPSNRYLPTRVREFIEFVVSKSSEVRRSFPQSDGEEDAQSAAKSAA